MADDGLLENTPLLQRGEEFDCEEPDLLESIVYAINSFTAVLKPISITMILASVVVSNIQSNTDEASFTAFDTNSDVSDTNTTRLEKSVANSLIIVAVLAIATFGIVCLYKFRFMKVLIGYMMLSSMSLLGIMGGVLALTVLETYSIPCDAFIFYGGCYNFAVVGVIAIFYKQGVPMLVTQAYLVFTAILMAWQLSKFEEWTGWSLLITLAFYDLCAVLSPCGPLKALVNLMQEYQEPMPGLLFEAEINHENENEKRNRYSSSHQAKDEHENSVKNADVKSKWLQSSHLGGDDESSYQSFNTLDKETGARCIFKNNPFEHHSPSSNRDYTRIETLAKTEYEEEEAENHVDDDNSNKSIKLGLGDFVFYGVLVSRAAQRGFTSGVICFLVVIIGLGATLVLLSVYRVALPALPISICLGVVFYMLSIFMIVPFLEEVSSFPVYF